MPPAIAPAAGAAAGTSTATTVAAYAAIAAAGVGAYSSIQQGRAAEEAGKFQAGLAAQEVEDLDVAKEFEERDLREEGRKLRARQLLQFAKGGVVPGTGTPLIMAEDTAEQVERDIGRMKYGYGLQQRRALSRGALARAEGKSQKRASRWSAGSSLLTGAYRAGSIYTRDN